MAKNKNKNKKTARVKSSAAQGEAGGGSAEAAATTAPTRKRTSPFAFIQQVRSETAKVTWPTRNEWFVTTIMVLIMVVLASSFFFLVDIVIKQAVQFLIGLAS